MTTSEREGHVDEPANSSSVPRFRLLTGGSLSHAALAAGGVLPGICLVQIADDFHLSDAQCGLFFAVAPTISFVTLPIFGLLAERFGKRGLLAAGLALLACAMAAYGGATDFSLMLAGSGLLGISGSIVDGLVSPLVVDLYPRRSAPVMNLVHCCFQVGIVFVALGAGMYLANEGLWRHTFLPVLIVAIAVSVTFAVTRFPPPSLHVEPLHLTGLLGNGRFWKCAVVIFMAGAVESGILVWVPAFLQRFDLAALGYWLTEALQLANPKPLLGGLGVALFAAPMVVGRWLYGSVAERFGYVPVLMASCTICAIGLVGLSSATTAGGSLIWLAILGLALSGVWPTLLILAGTTIHANTPTLFSLLAMAGLAGVSICNWGIGQLADVYGLQAGLAALVVPVVVSFVALAALGISDGKP